MDACGPVLNPTRFSSATVLIGACGECRNSTNCRATLAGALYPHTGLGPLTSSSSEAIVLVLVSWWCSTGNLKIFLLIARARTIFKQEFSPGCPAAWCGDGQGGGWHSMVGCAAGSTDGSSAHCLRRSRTKLAAVPKIGTATLFWWVPK